MADFVVVTVDVNLGLGMTTYSGTHEIQRGHARSLLHAIECTVLEAEHVANICGDTFANDRSTPYSVIISVKEEVY